MVGLHKLSFWVRVRVLSLLVKEEEDLVVVVLELLKLPVVQCLGRCRAWSHGSRGTAEHQRWSKGVLICFLVTKVCIWVVGAWVVVAELLAAGMAGAQVL